MRPLLPLLAIAVLLSSACTTDAPLSRSGGPGVGPSPGWQAFCSARCGSAADCDPIPRTAAMPDARPAMAPLGWHDYCRRNRQDHACAE